MRPSAKKANCEPQDLVEDDSDTDTDNEEEEDAKLPNWEIIENVVTENQKEMMARYLEKQLVVDPLSEAGKVNFPFFLLLLVKILISTQNLYFQYTNLICDVLIMEWALCIFIERYEYTSRKKALRHLKKQSRMIIMQFKYESPPAKKRALRKNLGKTRSR